MIDLCKGYTYIDLLFIYSSLLPLCIHLGYEKPIFFLFFSRYQHPFWHTSGASEIILTDPINRLVAGGKPAPGQNLPVISPPW
jgi:hypothetical protein